MATIKEGWSKGAYGKYILRSIEISNDYIFFSLYMGMLFRVPEKKDKRAPRRNFPPSESADVPCAF